MKFLLLQTPTPIIEQRDFNPGIVWQTLRDLGNGFFAQLPYIILGIIVVGVFVVIARVVKRVIHAAGQNTRLDVTLADLLGRLASLLIIILGVFVAAVVVFPAFKPGDLVAGLGITSVAVGFAFKDVLQNFFAGILILWRRPFVVGDQLKFREFEGTIEEINVR
jgi:small conductance mechanosensitive channel